MGTGQPFIGEIRLFAGDYAPLGWAFCNGQLIPVADNNALYALIGTSYGGDGVNTFALPDLRGRLAVGSGTSGGSTRFPGQSFGTETVALITPQLPAHTHAINALSTPGTVAGPVGNLPAASSGSNDYSSSPAADAVFALEAVLPTGSGTPHNNVQPFLALNFIIALEGVYPSQ